jgi:hypothetical protein
VTDPGPSPFRYHLELTPAQLKATHDALRALAADAGTDERTAGFLAEVLAMLPDSGHIAQIRPDDDGDPERGDEPPPPDLPA